MTHVPVSPAAMTIASNLRSFDPRLADVSDWRIDFAHRQYSTSEDFGDDLKVYEWLPDDTTDAALLYTIAYRVPELQRTISDLETLITRVTRERNEANRKLASFGTDGLVFNGALGNGWTG